MELPYIFKIIHSNNGLFSGVTIKLFRCYSRSIYPELFQVIKHPCFLVKYMNNNITVIK